MPTNLRARRLGKSLGRPLSCAVGAVSADRPGMTVTAPAVAQAAATRPPVLFYGRAVAPPEPPGLPGDSFRGLRPLSLATADFDGDGVADLAVGYATAIGGLVRVGRRLPVAPRGRWKGPGHRRRAVDAGATADFIIDVNGYFA